MDNNEYKKIILFSGTTEGRRLSELLCQKMIPHTVCVATDYGEFMQEKNEYVYVHKGRLDYADMLDFMGDNTRYIYDATHPYAVEVTRNIQKAAASKNIAYYRIIRERLVMEATMDINNKVSANAAEDSILYFDSTLECAEELNNIDGNILITTGSKEINVFAGSVKDNSRLFVRVLPSAESINLCQSAGIKSDHIIGMHGPFSKEMNKVIMEQYGIRCLVTKESGANGGFAEKIDAANELGVVSYVIKRPVEESGLSVDEAFENICKSQEESDEKTYEVDESGEKSDEVEGNGEKSDEVEESGGDSHESEEDRGYLEVAIIGQGMGNASMMTLEAVNAVRYSQAVFGAKRIVENVAEFAGGAMLFTCYLANEIVSVVEHFHLRNIAVVFSGDTGFYSGAVKFRQQIAEWAKNNHINLVISEYPGISSVSALAAITGTDYSDAKLISLHGKNEKNQIYRAAKAVKYNAKTFVLLSGADDLVSLSEALADEGIDGEMIVGSRLSYKDQDVSVFPIGQVSDCNYPVRGLYTVLVKNFKPSKRRLIPCYEDSEFIRDKVPMTKGVIRHECVRLLNIHEGDTVYDIGAGTGSVSLEIAGLSEYVNVIAVEKKPEAVNLIKCNCEQLGIKNIKIIEGKAPLAITDATEIAGPDAVFIGGSSGELMDILDAVSKKNSTFRCVITAGTLETTSQLSKLKNNENINNLEIIQINHSVMKNAGDYQLMEAMNPVTIAAFDYVKLR